MKESYTIFISYRRNGGFETASLIAEKLRNAGYRVFMDIDSLRSGKFNEQLYGVIERCSDMLVVLPQDGLERCSDENDWVRLEVAHAMKHRKNIVPVLLRGFAWPVSMPEEFAELKNYQGIAAGSHEYFDASVEKLKGYLRSKPVRWSGRRFKRTAVGLAVLLLAVGALLFGVYRSSIPVCREQADKLTAGMAVIDLLGQESDAIDLAWRDFYGQYAKASAADTAFLRAEIRQALDFHRKQIAQWRRKMLEPQLDNLQRWLLQIQGIHVADIETFHRSLYPSFFDDAYHAVELLEEYPCYGDIPEVSVRSSGISAEFFRHSANGTYYAYLEMLALMPEAARKTYVELSPEWRYLPSSIGVTLSQAEYERLQQMELKRPNS